jgi:hypothetical protein
MPLIERHVSVVAWILFDPPAVLVVHGDEIDAVGGCRQGIVLDQLRLLCPTQGALNRSQGISQAPDCGQTPVIVMTCFDAPQDRERVVPLESPGIFASRQRSARSWNLSSLSETWWPESKVCTKPG